MKILSLVIEDLGSIAEVARTLGVTRTTVHDWVHDPKKHPSNEHTDKLLRIAKEKRGNKVRKILLRELESFEKLIKSFVPAS